MNILKQVDNNRIITTAKQKTYQNVQFNKGFVQFMESLVFNDLISSDYTREQTTNSIVWDNKLLNGGIIFETNTNPLTAQVTNETIDVTVTGNKDTLETFEYLLRLNEVTIDDQSLTHDINIKVEYHDTLNPKLWKKHNSEYTLHTDVLDALDTAALEFFEFLDMPNLELLDVTLTGSSANYNWTSSSDIDLHLVVDIKDVEKEYGVLATQYFTAQRKVWNDQHDIQIKGIPVEFYVQDSKEPHHSTGIYSIENLKWVEEPKKQKPELDFNSIRTKAHQYMEEIDELLKGCNKPGPIETMMDKLIKLRKAGLEEAGEFSSENLVFKVLRNYGYIDKLSDCKTKSIDRELSVEEEELFKKDDPWEDIGYSRNYKSKTTTPSEPRSKVWLNVPYSQRESAKRLGAKWDSGLRKWYITTTIAELKNIPTAWR